MSEQPLKNIVILGGGSAGWLTAAALSKSLAALSCDITLIESEEIGIIGVGEATIPPIVDFLKYLQIDEADFLREVSGTYKLAIKFSDWRKLGESYYHPFGAIGVSIEGQSFYSCWLKSVLQGDTSKFTDYSAAVHLADQNKFYNPNLAPKESCFVRCKLCLAFRC
jgi:tryptophan 7-halogenase